MPVITYDSVIFIKYQPTELPKGFRLSAVVLMELTTGADDDKEVKYWNEVRRAREKDGTLLIPTAEDWWFAGKVLYSLQIARRGGKHGMIPKSDPVTIQRITRDVLIARTAKRAGALLVTDNLSDFELISQFCKVKTISAKDHFGL